jgi:hypothetical protein
VAPGDHHGDEGTKQMNCPVCGNSAESLPRTFDGDAFRCKTCGDYGISGTVLVLEKWKNLGLMGRLQALANAKVRTKPGTMPIVTDYSF